MLYSRKEDNKKLYAGERDRILSETEEGAVRKVLVKKEEHLLFDMALETAMRLSEMFTLTWDQVDFERKTIFLGYTKTSRPGRSGKRQIPITSVLFKLLFLLIVAMVQPHNSATRSAVRIMLPPL